MHETLRTMLQIEKHDVDRDEEETYFFIEHLLMRRRQSD